MLIVRQNSFINIRNLSYVRDRGITFLVRKDKVISSKAWRILSSCFIPPSCLPIHCPAACYARAVICSLLQTAHVPVCPDMTGGIPRPCPPSNPHYLIYTGAGHLITSLLDTQEYCPYLIPTRWNKNFSLNNS